MVCNRNLRLNRNHIIKFKKVVKEKMRCPAVSAVSTVDSRNSSRQQEAVGAVAGQQEAVGAVAGLS